MEKLNFYLTLITWTPVCILSSLFFLTLFLLFHCLLFIFLLSFHCFSFNFFIKGSNGELYNILAHILELLIPMFERVINDLHNPRPLRYELGKWYQVSLSFFLSSLFLSPFTQFSPSLSPFSSFCPFSILFLFVVIL